MNEHLIVLGSFWFFMMIVGATLTIGGCDEEAKRRYGQKFHYGSKFRRKKGVD